MRMYEAIMARDGTMNLVTIIWVVRKNSLG
jgi:hypothetical protein